VQPPARLNEALAALSEPLQDISISRLRNRVHWAIEVPDDPEHSVYVWLDALTVYLSTGGITAQGEPAVWPPSCQVLGKDILRFHSIYWPAFLMALQLPLPRLLHVHAHWTANNQKMSKSIGNVVAPGPLLETYGVDAVRYFLLRDCGVTDDSLFAEERVEQRLDELANVLGNLISRVTAPSMLPNGRCPAATLLQDPDQRLLHSLSLLPPAVDESFSRLAFAQGLERIFAVLNDCNAYMTEMEPWKLRAEEEEPRKHTILAVCHEVVRVVAILLQPVMPTSADSAMAALAVPATARSFGHACECNLGGSAGLEVKHMRSLFPKVARKAQAAKSKKKGA